MKQQELDTIMVFTARSPVRIIREGGSQAWKLNAVYAKNFRYALCTQNAKNSDDQFQDATEPHGMGFLIGRISEIRRSPEPNEKPRWLIAFSEYARVEIDNAWDHLRYPVRYVTLAQFGITDPDSLDWKPMPEAGAEEGDEEERKAAPPLVHVPAMLTIEQAKIGLAATFKVKPEAIDIRVRY